VFQFYEVEERVFSSQLRYAVPLSLTVSRFGCIFVVADRLFQLIDCFS